MKLTDLVTTVGFALLFAFSRCLGKKWHQLEAIGQGLPLAVDMMTLYAQREEHIFYETDAFRLIAESIFRAR